MKHRRPVPRSGALFSDERGEDRCLRVSWHQDAQLVVLSLWHDNVCVGTFRLAADDVPDMVASLRLGLDEAYEIAAQRLERAREWPGQAG